MAKKLTNDEFVKRANIIHNNFYSYPEKYVNGRQKIRIICPIHGDFYQTPKAHLNKQGCPICAKVDKYPQKVKDFLRKAKNKFHDKYSFPYIENEYVDNKSKITVHCNDCNNEYKKAVLDFLRSDDGGCQVCRYNKKWLKSFDDINNVYHLHDLIPFKGLIDVNPRKNNTVSFNCEKHGIFTVKAYTALNSKCECPKCKGKIADITKRVSFDDFDEKIKEKYGDSVKPIKLTFVNMNTPMKFICNTCGSIFKRTPSSILYENYKNVCPICSQKEQTIERTKTNEDFIKDAINLYGKNAYSFDKLNYIKSSETVTIKCNTCGRYFTIEANSFLQGHGCPYHNHVSSLMEKELADFIKTLYKGKIFQNDRTVLEGKELDIYIPDKSLAFEFDGLYWHNELIKDEKYHLDKTICCENKGIRLIHIFEDEWLTKKDIWLSMISNIFGLTNNKIYARKCIIKDVDAKEAVNFLNNNHLQGWCPSSIKIGLYYNEELVSLMTFGKSRHFVGNGKAEYELVRFCNKLNTNVIGGASKLFHYFIKTYNPNEIISFADRRWSNGNLYDVLQFNLYNISKPNYYYVIGSKRYNRFNFRKSILVKKYNCPLDMSEHDFCKSQKWYRIYDCGCLCYKWLNKSNLKN